MKFANSLGPAEKLRYDPIEAQSEFALVWTYWRPIFEALRKLRAISERAFRSSKAVDATMATKLLPLRKLSRILKVPSSSFYSSPCFRKYSYLLEASRPLLDLSDNVHQFHPPSFSRSFCSRPLDFVDDDSRGPASIDYSSLMQEGNFHRLADSTIHGLQEKLEEYGDDLQIDGFDVDYGNEVLTLKLGNLGTYVLNKQTPNRQIWLSSPVSGPSRFDWDQNSQAWIYRRNKANLLRLLETELAELCGEPIGLC